MSLSTKILLGLILGIVTGAFFGESVGFLETVGIIFIQLLQMAVLPYVTVSLIAGLGRLTYSDALALAKVGGTLLVLLWGIAMGIVMLMPLAFPTWESASFFSTSMIEQQREFDFLTLFIPANPFYSLANTVVPAVVLFSIVTGIALIGIQNKDHLIANLSIFGETMMRVMQLVMQLAPIGVFAIASSAAGTMQVEEFGRWQVYMLTYLMVWILLSFWILPMLVTSLTPLTYRDLLGLSRDVLITAFATGNLLIVLPVLAERSKLLLARCMSQPNDSGPVVDVMIPTSFNFPNIGKLMTLSFVLFAGWFSGTTVAIAEYPTFAALGLTSFFGDVAVAIPFLLDALRIPADMFQLFLVSDVIISRFGTMLAAMHTMVLAILGTLAMSGQLTVRWGKVIRYTVITGILCLTTILGTRVFFTMALEHHYSKDEILPQMHLSRKLVPATIHASPPPAVDDVETSRLEVIRERGTLRVGYRPDSLPFSFINAKDDLVGFDIEMAHILANELGVELEFVPIDLEKVGMHLTAGHYDMASFATTTNRALQMAFSAPYLDLTLAFVVKDYRRDEFTSWDSIARIGALKIGIPNVPYYVSFVRDRLPQANVIPLTSTDVRSFFDRKGETLDALVYPAETGSAWTLLYPEYSIVVPAPDVVTVPSAYALPQGEQEMVDFMNTWLELKKRDRTIPALYDYWILGKDAVRSQPRWSVIRDVLGWVD